jgi:hypothetical protein
MRNCGHHRGCDEVRMRASRIEWEPIHMNRVQLNSWLGLEMYWTHSCTSQLPVDPRITLSPFVEQLQRRGNTVDSAFTKGHFETIPKRSNSAFIDAFRHPL